MDAETQKPFACKAKGCGMSFTNEDHLTVHEKKHDMMLNLGISGKGAGSFIADQTPTPTRLIKNCEEVGLFDDLKHVNPFDETFRRAVEGKGENTCIETASSSENLNQTDDSLHTPQVFPQFETSTPPTAASSIALDLPTVVGSSSTTPSTGDSCNEFAEGKQLLFSAGTICEEKRRVAKKKSKETKKLACIASKPANILPAGQLLVPATISIVPATQIVALSIPAASLVQRPMLLPKLCTQHMQNAPSPTEISVKDRLKAHLSNSKTRSPTTPPADDAVNKSTYNCKSSKNLKHAPKEVLDDCLERRRAAALRYRRKVKKEQNDLRRRNAELAAENTQLKTLVKQLREELLCAQQSCSLQGSMLLQHAGQSLFRGSKSRPSTIQIPIATPMRVVLQNEGLPTSMAATVVKIPVPNVE